MRVGVGSLAILVLTASVAGASSIVPVSPGRSATVDAIAQSCPTFSWESRAGASRIELVVYEVPEVGVAADLLATAPPVIEASLPGGATSWTPRLDQCLESGGSYAWSVRARGTDRVGEWAPPTLFRVVERSKIDDVEEAVRVLRRYLAERTPANEAAAAAVSPAAVPATSIAIPLSEPPQQGILETNLDVEGRGEFDVVRLADTGGNSVFWDLQEEVNNDMTFVYGGERMRLTAGGSLGLGTGATVDQRLHVAGTAQADTLRLGDTAGNGVFWDIAEDASNDLIFTYVSDRVKFRSNGFVGIGTAGAPQQTLEVNGIVRLSLDAAGATAVCLDADGDLSNCGLDPIKEAEALRRLVDAQSKRIERLEAALCASGVDSGLCDG